MAWIESHQNLRDHPKTKRMARRLGINVPQAIGHLHCLWWWAMEYAVDGDLSRYEPADVADGALWDGDPDQFIEALIYAGFVDRDEHGLRLHDWEDYAGRLIERRRRDAERKRQERVARREMSEGRPADVRRTSAVRPTDVRPTSAPNLNLTVPDHEEEREHFPLTGESAAPAPDGAVQQHPAPGADPFADPFEAQEGAAASEDGAAALPEDEKVSPAPRRSAPRLVPLVPHQAIADAWNRICGDVLPRVQVLSDRRKEMLRARCRELARTYGEAVYTLQWWEQVFRRVRDSPFCCGENDRRWRADFDWLVGRRDAVVRVLEGRYDRQEPPPSERPRRPRVLRAEDADAY